MYQKILYLSQKRDKDIIGLLNDIGAKNFRKCTYCCLRALFNRTYIEKAKTLSREKVENGENTYLNYITEGPRDKAGIKFWLSMNSEQDENIRILLNNIKENCVSIFIKTTIRQVLGPQILLKYILKEETQIEIGDITFTSFINMGTPVAIPQKKRAKRKPTRIKKVQNKEETVKHTTMDIPSFHTESNDIPSFTSQVSIKEEDINITTESDTNEDDFDVLSMLEGML